MPRTRPLLLALVLAIGLWPAPGRAAEPGAHAPGAAGSALPIRCPMLGYHEVPSGAGFEEQLEELVGAGYRPVGLATLVEALRGGYPPPPGCLVLSFDDGLASQYRHALPVLRRRGLRAVFFVMPDFRDGDHAYMEPHEIRHLAAAGMEVGSHTLNHANLPRLRQLDIGAFRAELVLSKQFLEEIAGRPIQFFAYPHGAVDPPTAEEVRRAGYRAAAGSEPGAWQAPAWLYALRRLRADPWEPPAALLDRLAAPPS